MIPRSLHFALISVCVFGTMLLLSWQEGELNSSTPIPVGSMADISSLFEGKPLHLQLDHFNLYYTNWEVPVYSTRVDFIAERFERKEYYAAVEYQDGYLLARIPQKLLQDDVTVLRGISTTVRLNKIYSAGDDHKAYLNLVQKLADINQLSYEEMQPVVPYAVAAIEGDMRGEPIRLIAIYGGCFTASAFALIAFLWQRADYRRGSLYRQLATIADAQQLENAIDNAVAFKVAVFASRSKLLQDSGLVTDQVIVAMHKGRVKVFPAQQLRSVHMEDEAYRVSVFTVGKKPRLVLHFLNSNKPAYISSSSGLISSATVSAIVQKFGILGDDEKKESIREK